MGCGVGWGNEVQTPAIEQKPQCQNWSIFLLLLFREILEVLDITIVVYQKYMTNPSVVETTSGSHSTQRNQVAPDLEASSILASPQSVKSSRTVPELSSIVLNSSKTCTRMS